MTQRALHVIVLLPLALSSASAITIPFSFPIPTKVTAARTVQITWYHAYFAFTSGGADARPIPGVDARPLSQPLSPWDWCQAALQGTVRTKTSSGTPITLNFIKRGPALTMDCRRFFPSNPQKAVPLGFSQFAPAVGAFGDGVRGYQLIPFRTVAADLALPDRQPGTVLYIPSLRGKSVPMPGGITAIHDGYVMVADRGGMITGQHLDLFVGDLQEDEVPAWLARWKTFGPTVQWVNEPAVSNALQRLHRP